MGTKKTAMVLNSNASLQGLRNTKTIVLAALLGIILLVIPVLMIFIDPIFVLAKFKLRITKGSVLYELMKHETETARLEIHLFNATNAERFLRGEDQKLRVQEVGPFVYQEYRSHEEIDLDLETGVLRFIPRFRAEFVEEKSVGRPEETMLVVPHVPYILSPEPFMSIDVHKYLWGYQDKVIQMCKNLIPGVMYYDSLAIFDTLYDRKADYKMEMDITLQNKFQVRRVMKKLREKSWNSSDLVQTKYVFQDTYEGAAFPPQMTPQMSLNTYRPGVCKTLGWEYAGRKRMKLGADTFLYRLTNKTFGNTRLCDSKGLCPHGAIDLSSCYLGLPIAITMPHLIDVDSEFQQRVDGLVPDKEKYLNYIEIEPKIGLTVETSVSLQLNLLLGDMRFMPDLAKFSDMLLPLAHAKMTLPELPAATKNSLTLLYVTGPQILLGLEIASALLGLALLVYSLALLRRDWSRRRDPARYFDDRLKGKVRAELPLIS
ncbi:sensory neuron membrane protein 1 isoform X2 [Manduca sexta]|uniref:Uncharacterized protein n=1 Tax=Manduca sexta TaxID=7130 RepID=A0A922CSZ0_MANSE|nr:sensory neuron membrane protein 1 isoform X2 [Manduca sexta]KAG6456996.1 hypothetical protein O3G_MSEX010080 [Manduca sexta]